MPLHLLDFDCSEDVQGVVCWDALAQPRPQYNSALLREVAQLLAWAHAFDTPGPGSLEDGACWDFDLQVSLLHDGLPAQTAQPQWTPSARHNACGADERLSITPTPGPQQRISLSLSLSGTPGFAEAFRAQFELP
jgi:hypothetical protein